MNQTFWQMNVGQLVTLLGFLGTLVVFFWRTAELHFRGDEKVKGLAKDVEEQGVVIDKHDAALDELRQLCKVSEKRLELVEQELRDNRQAAQVHVHTHTTKET